MKNIRRFLSVLLILIILIPSTIVFSRAGGGFRGGFGGGSRFSSSDSSGFLKIFSLLFFVFCFLFIIVEKLVISSKERKTLAYIKDLEINDPYWNCYEIEAQIERSFLSIQEAWMNRDYSPVRSLMTDDFYNTHSEKIKQMILRGEKNILKNIKLENITYILAMKSDVDGNDYLWVLLDAKMIDYIIEEKNNMIKKGDSSKKQTFQEFWRFIKKDDKWLADKILQTHEFYSYIFFSNKKK